MERERVGLISLTDVVHNRLTILYNAMCIVMVIARAPMTGVTSSRAFVGTSYTHVIIGSYMRCLPRISQTVWLKWIATFMPNTLI